MNPCRTHVSADGAIIVLCRADDCALGIEVTLLAHMPGLDHSPSYFSRSPYVVLVN